MAKKSPNAVPPRRAELPAVPTAKRRAGMPGMGVGEVLAMLPGPRRDAALLGALRVRSRSSRGPKEQDVITHLDEEEKGDERERSLREILGEHQLLIKYKPGDPHIRKIKRSLRRAGLLTLVKVRTAPALRWSPQYFLNGDLTSLEGFLPIEILRLSLLDQLDEWDEESDPPATDEDEDEEIEAEEAEEAEEEVEAEEKVGVADVEVERDASAEDGEAVS